MPDHRNHPVNGPICGTVITKKIDFSTVTYEIPLFLEPGTRQKQWIDAKARRVTDRIAWYEVWGSFFLLLLPWFGYVSTRNQAFKLQTSNKYKMPDHRNHPVNGPIRGTVITKKIDFSTVTYEIPLFLEPDRTRRPETIKACVESYTTVVVL